MISTIKGQLGDKVLVEPGKGSVYLKADAGGGDDTIVMMSPEAAEALATTLRHAAELARTWRERLKPAGGA